MQFSHSSQMAQQPSKYAQVALTSEDPVLSLQAWPRESYKSENIPFLISRISAQRGSFRTITESSLAQEAEAIEANEGGTGDDEKSSALDSRDGKTSAEDIFKARGEIMQTIAYGHGFRLITREHSNAKIGKLRQKRHTLWISFRFCFLSTLRDRPNPLFPPCSNRMCHWGA